MNKKNALRIGFILPPGDWLGGRNYLRNLFAAMRTLPDEPLVPVLFSGKRQSTGTADFYGIEEVKTSVLDRQSPAGLVRRAAAKIGGRDFVLETVLKRHGIAVLSHSFHLGKQSTIPTIGWIPDFQHLHLPAFFTSEDLLQRDNEFKSLCLHCDRVIVSSGTARRDLETFSPADATKAEVLQFVAGQVSLTGASSRGDLEGLYSFGGKYFLLPNQFWTHKNHRVVIEALQILKQRGEPMLVLATGSTEDYRNPSFYASLMSYAAECDVLDCFRVLGKIPYNHLTGLMRDATAFINPSLFEGWSTSVEEAKSMGKQIVLSDLAVHLEQAPERGFFFPAKESERLVEAMQGASNSFDEHEDGIMQHQAADRFPERQRAFGETYLRIVRRALGN